MLPHVLFFGPDLGSSSLTGDTHYFRGVLSALAVSGVPVTAYPCGPDDESASSAWRVAAACRTSGRADVVIGGCHDETSWRVVPRLLHIVKPGQTTVLWLAHPIEALEWLHTRPNCLLQQALVAADLVFLSTAHPQVRDRYAALGVHQVVAMPHAVDSRAGVCPKPSHLFRADVSTLATRSPGREGALAEFFWRPAAALPDRHFLLGGLGWHDTYTPSNVAYVGPVPPSDRPVFYRSARLVLDVCRGTTACDAKVPSMHLLDAAAVGACVVSDGGPGVEALFEPEREVLVASDAEDMVDIVASTWPAQTRIIGEAARRRVLAQHTFEHRAAVALACLTGRQQRWAS